MTETTLLPGWATYLRVSDEDKQTPERSFAMQRQHIQKNLLSPTGLPVFREYRDLLTGTTANRADYQQLLIDAESGRFSHLGLYRADRFGRNTIEGLQAATKLIGLGVKIRVANMPPLQPEEPDGFFMFMLQMGLAQREVDVLRQRTRDGMEAKLRAGGWPNKAPEGYINKEKQIKSGKYHRWVEPDPIMKQCLREAWDLLLTNRYTLDQICEELTLRGYTRSGGRPWVWTMKSGIRRTARNRLHEIFHNPFYAGWVFSKRFEIPYGEIQGKWEPIISPEEYERGLNVLRHRNENRANERIHFYLLRNVLWVKVKGRRYRMYGSTPSGRSRSYPYYITHAKPGGKSIHIRCENVDEQVPDWLQNVSVDPELIPAIRNIYQEQIRQTTADERAQELSKQQHYITQLRQEEARLGRLHITGKMTEEVYDQLRAEWLEKIQHAEANLRDLERAEALYLDDLDVALALLSQVSTLYERLEERERATLLQILAKRIIVTTDGEIIDHEFHSPFKYLTSLVTGPPYQSNVGSGSAAVRHCSHFTEHRIGGALMIQDTYPQHWHRFWQRR